MSRNVKIFTIILVICLFFTLGFRTNAKEEIDMAEVDWDYSAPFIYDNTPKTVVLKNVPVELKVSYSGNVGTEISTYEATAVFSYDSDSYELINYDAKRYNHFSWQIRRGIYDTSMMEFNSMSFIEDGNPHYLRVTNLPEGLNVTYEGNGQSEPGIYDVTANFKGNEYYAPVSSKTATLTILRRRIYSTDGLFNVLSNDVGFHPDLVLNYEYLDLEQFADVDLSVAGSYREIKQAFTLNLSLDGNLQSFNNNIIVEVPIALEDLYNADLVIYRYSGGYITIVDTNQNDRTLTFEARNFAEAYLIIGMRSTYTDNQIWKVFLILFIILLFIVGVIVWFRVYSLKKRNMR